MGILGVLVLTRFAKMIKAIGSDPSNISSRNNVSLSRN